MPLLRSASLCAIFAFILFSGCKRSKKTTELYNPPVTDPARAASLPEKPLNISSLQQVFMDHASQHFSVRGKRISTLISKAGLRIKVDPGVLETEDGSALAGNIDVKIIELTNVEDLFKSNAATMSNGRLLISGGSYFIGMQSGGSKIRIKEGKKLSIEFPMLKKGEMELFYGERNELSDMNWQRADIPLETKYEAVSFTNYNSPDNDNPVLPLLEMAPAKVFRTLEDDVFYYNRKLTLNALVDTLNKLIPKVYLQAISFWPKNLPTDRRLDTNYLINVYGPRKQYMLKTCASEQEEKDALEKRKALAKEAMAKWKPASLEGQLQKYYAPAGISMLGWINCDRFYKSTERTEIDLELPYTFNNNRVEYFILFKSFNGLMNNRVDYTQEKKAALKDLPVGEEVTFIAFTKNNGIVYHAKEDFVIEKNKKLPLNFMPISGDEINKIFGKNVKI